MLYGWGKGKCIAERDRPILRRGCAGGRLRAHHETTRTPPITRTTTGPMTGPMTTATRTGTRTPTGTTSVTTTATTRSTRGGTTMTDPGQTPSEAEAAAARRARVEALRARRATGATTAPSRTPAPAVGSPDAPGPRLGPERGRRRRRTSSCPSGKRKSLPCTRRPTRRLHRSAHSGRR